MRKAVWGTVSLGVFALTFGSPIREFQPWHGIISLTGLAGYLLLSFDPPTTDPRQRKLLLAGILASVASFILVVTGAPFPANLLARVLAVATVALPLWLVAGPARYAFVAAATLALFTGLPAVADAGRYATSVHAYVTALSAFAVAALLQKPTIFMMEKRPTRIVVASNIVTYTPEEKARALARLEQRYRNGELEEHIYLDKRQELESK